MSRKIDWKSKAVYAVLALAVIIGIFPLTSSIAHQFVDTSTAGYQFTDTAVRVKQMIPYYDSGVAVLYNDDSIVIYQKQGEVLQSRVTGAANINRLIDETRAITNEKKVIIWNPDADSYAYAAQTVEGLSNVVAATPHYYVSFAGGSQFEIKYFNNNVTQNAESLFSMDNVTAIADSGTGGILLKSDGTVYTWNGNDKTPVPVSGLSDIAAIDNNTALSKSGEVYTWGSNITGKLGNGASADSKADTPVKVAGLPKIAAVTATESQVYAVASDGSVYYWGESNAGSYARVATPQKLDISNAKEIFAAAHAHNAAYALKTDDTVSVLGYSAIDAGTLTDLLSPKTAITSLSKNLSTNITYSGSLSDLPGGQIAGTAGGQTVAVNIDGWECETDFNPLVKGSYVFYPVVSVQGNYKVVSSILPKITVAVAQGAGQITSGTYSVNTQSGYLSKIGAGTTVGTLLSGISANGGTVQVKKDGNAVAADTPIGTGMTVELYAGDTKVQALTIVVTGDVNGDGVIDITDLVRVNMQILQKKDITSEFERKGADVNGDGTIDITDLVQINLDVLQKKKIQPID